MDKVLSGEECNKLLQGCKALIFKWTSVHFKAYLDRAEAQLQHMGTKAGSQERAHLMLAGHSIRDHHRAIERRLLEHLGIAFRHHLEHRDTAADLGQEYTGLALVDNDVLERTIALSTMVRRASADFGDAIYALNQRLSVISGGHKVEDLGNPVAPAVFVEALQAALAELKLDTPTLLVIYKTYDGALMTRLGKLYDLLNHDLKNKGVLPHLRYQIRKHETPMLPDELAALISERSQTRQAELMATVQTLRSALMAAHVPIGPVAPTQQIISQLQPLQLQIARQLAALDVQGALPEPANTELLPQLRQQQRHAAHIDAEVIEIVGLVFDYVLNDEQLPDSVKALLSYLHTPFLKVALLDREFFNHPQHPARLLLNSLVAAGERWVEAEGKHRSDVLQQMRAVVKRILDEFNDDQRLFSQLAFEFNQYLRQHARRVQLAEQRAMQAARGEDKLTEVRLQVERYLQQKTATIELPAEVRTLLFEPWANVLAFNLLRFGSNSAQWRSVVRVIDDVLLHLRGDTAVDQTDLDTRLRAGFETVGYESSQGQRLLHALHDHHQKNLAAGRATAAVASVDIDTLPGAPPPQDPILKELLALEFGTWFVFRADQPARSRYQAKLAWFNVRTQHFMFVNRLGQQIAVRLGSDLADDIRSGRVHILNRAEDKPFFERALERIAEQLRRRTR